MKLLLGSVPMKVLLVDDHPLFVEGLKNLLVAHGIEVVASASDGLEALYQAREARPDIVLMDLMMRGYDGLDGISFIKAELPEVKVVVLTMYQDREHLLEAMRRGASGYLLKSVKTQELLDLLAYVANGETVISRDMAYIVMQELAQQLQNEPDKVILDRRAMNPLERLTPRQADILRRVALGQTNREIATALGIGERTVQYHMSGIFRKLHLCNRAQVVAYAQRSS
jgi:DNA-binding NarL/FixJ family response regulator